MTAVEMFEQTYKKAPQYTAFTPYRICPLGAHSDHQLGKITGFAIDKGIHVAYGPKENGVIEIQSCQFPKRAHPRPGKMTGRTISEAQPLRCISGIRCAGDFARCLTESCPLAV